MPMLHHFEYNGEDSRNYNLYIKNKQSYNKPERDISFISVPGRNGDLILDNGGYRNLDITYEVRLIVGNIYQDEKDIEHSLNKVTNWLMPTNNYYILTDSYVPSYYRKACLKSIIQVTQLYKDIIDFEINFTCKPYMYKFEGDEKIEITSTMKINNEENSASLPLIRLYCTDEYQSLTDSQKLKNAVTFHINGNSYQVFNVDNYVDIDSEQMNVYKNTTNMNMYYIGERFPELLIGNNVISLGKNAKKIELIPRWRSI